MQRIGILGGTFDPPHLGHLLIAEEVRIQLNLDEIWFIPTNDPPHKKKTKTSGQNRIEMTRRAIADNPKFKLNLLEFERVGKSYTIDTVEALQIAHPHIEFYFIIGADMVQYLQKWHRIDELIKKITFIGVKRTDYHVDTEYPVQIIDIPLFDVSSSFIRERIANEQSFVYFLSNPVYAYIKEQHLYENQ